MGSSHHAARWTVVVHSTWWTRVAHPASAHIHINVHLNEEKLKFLDSRLNIAVYTWNVDCGKTYPHVYIDYGAWIGVRVSLQEI